MVTTTREGTITILKPTAPPKVIHGPLAQRPATLSGLQLGLLDNVKVGAAAFLDRIEERLREDFAIAGVVRRTKPTASRGMPGEIEAALRECHIVVNAFGD